MTRLEPWPGMRTHESRGMPMRDGGAGPGVHADQLERVAAGAEHVLRPGGRPSRRPGSRSRPGRHRRPPAAVQLDQLDLGRFDRWSPGTTRAATASTATRATRAQGARRPPDTSCVHRRLPRDVVAEDRPPRHVVPSDPPPDLPCVISSRPRTTTFLACRPRCGTAARTARSRRPPASTATARRARSGCGVGVTS